jgi:TRAP transporter TAXI family solute receptor
MNQLTTSPTCPSTAALLLPDNKSSINRQLLKQRLVRLTGTLLFGIALLAGAATGHAQTIGIGTTKGGATAQISNAIANTVSANSSVQVRPQAMANTQQYIPLVNSGKIELGLANVPQTRYSVSGTGMSEGKPNPDLRMIVTLFPFRAGVLAATDTGIVTAADLKGKKLPRFKERALGDYIYRSFLDAAGLTYDDVVSVPASNFPTMWKMLKEGQIDSAIVAVGSKPAFDFDASLGGVSFVDLGKDSAETTAANLPGSFVIEVNGKTPGEGDGRHAIGFDYALFAHKDVADDVVTEVVRAMYENPDALQSSSPLWKNFNPATMGKDVGVDFHPAAIAFYKAQGIWQR